MDDSEKKPEVAVTSTLDKQNLRDQVESPIESTTLQYPLRPRAKGVYPKKSSLMPPSSELGLYSLGAVFTPLNF